jgi:hypothetical protein
MTTHKRTLLRIARVRVHGRDDLSLVTLVYPPEAETPKPDWLTAQAKAIGTARPKKPKAAYVRRLR